MMLLLLVLLSLLVLINQEKQLPLLLPNHMVLYLMPGWEKFGNNINKISMLKLMNLKFFKLLHKGRFKTLPRALSRL